MKKTIIISGANKRIGLFLTGYFISLNYDVIALVKNQNISRELQTLKSLNQNNIAIVEKDFLTSQINYEFWDTLKNVDLAGFIHCASIFNYDTIENATPNSIREHQIINSDSFVEACTTYCQYKKDNISEPISFISFLDSKIDNINPEHYSYTLSKLSLQSNIKFLAMTGAPKIRVNAIAPGLTLPSGNQTQEEFERAQHKLPYGFGVTLEDIAQTAAYLIMMPSINGQIINLDAGQHLQKTKDIIF